MFDKSFLTLLFGGALYFLWAKFGMSFFSIQPQNISLIWIPFGIGVTLVQKYGLRASFVIFIASFLSHFNFTTDIDTISIIHRVFPSLADAFAPVLSIFLIRKYVKADLVNISELLPFTIFGGIIPTFASAVVITLNWVIAGSIKSDEITDFIVLLIFSDTMGLILIYPLVKYYDKYEMSTKERYLLLRGVFFGTAIVVLSIQYQFLIFLLYPLLLISAFELRTKYLMMLLSIITIMTMMIINSFEIHFSSSHETMSPVLMIGSFLSTLIFIILGVSLHNNELEYNKYLTLTDALTKIFNRKAFDEKIEEFLQIFSRYHEPFSLILFDIDNFKDINDTLGHQEGDKVLIELTNLVKKNLRINDSFYRVGGEEFAILLPHTNLQTGEMVSEKIRNIIESNLKSSDGRKITVSVGLTQVKEDDTQYSIYARVDDLQYSAKKNGKNQVCTDF